MSHLSLRLVLTSILVMSAVARAGDVRGKVLDAQGAPIAKAKVVVASPSNGKQWEAATQSDGSYDIPEIGAGVYSVTVTLAANPTAMKREISVADFASVVRADFQAPPAPAAAERVVEEQNPNIFVYQIDTNSLRNRLQVVRGADTQYIPVLPAEQNYYGAEYGAPLWQFELVRPRSLASSWRGAVTGSLQNSSLNARNFFNVGPLLPSRASGYGIAVGGPLLTRKVSSLFQLNQNFTSGMVNGNIQAPLDDERAPRAADPRVRAIISDLLQAYPADRPNLPGVSLRQLNSNAPRDIKTTDALTRLDFAARRESAVALRYTISNYDEEPFQIVAGQNPETYLRNQGAHASWTQTFSPKTVGRYGFHYDRSTALLEPTQRFSQLLAPLGIATVPDIDISDEVSGIGPGEQFPRRRIQSRFQPYTDFAWSAGSHTLKIGWSSARTQLNDLQSDSDRGVIRFARDFGRSAVENFLLGTPSTFSIAIGNLYRGFRNWEHAGFVEDQIRVSNTFSVNLGLRYELMTAPVEVNNLTDTGFPTDKNNFAPRAGLAWNPHGGKTTIRASYGISYGSVFPVTYQTTRFNPPAIKVLRINAPDFLNPLGSGTGTVVDTSRSERFLLSPDLVFPYSHQYSFGIERPLPWNSTLRLAYVGTRSFHVLAQSLHNRPLPDPNPACYVPGRTPPCNTTANINDRRPDPRYLAVKVVESSAIAYYDAFQMRFDKRLSRGLTVRATYTFSKSIDTGADFTNTAIDVQAERGGPTSETASRFSDLKGWSNFDTPHALAINYAYDFPNPASGSGWKVAILRGWQISGVTTFQSGTPFHLHTGSDGPGIGNVDGDTTDRPNILKPSLLGKSIDNPNTSTTILNRAFFDTNIPVGGRGNIGFNVFRKDGTNNWNLGLGKSMQLPGGREKTMLFRADFLNLMNHAQFQKPGNAVTNPNFGKIINTVNKGRQVQFSLRITF